MNDRDRMSVDNETDITIKNIRKDAPKRDPKEALKAVLTILQSKGCVHFNFLDGGGDEEVPQWILRIPKEEGEMANEAIRILHICSPLGLWEAVETPDPEETIANSAYTVDGKCLRCKVEAPAGLEQRFEKVRKFLVIGKAIS